MKKILLGAVPFLGLAFLVGCGPQQVDYKVNEDDFYKGVNFTDTQYMQIKMTNATLGQTSTFEFSPNIFHLVEETGAEGYWEKFVAKQADIPNKFCEFERYGKDKEYTYTENLDEGDTDWLTPQNFEQNLFYLIGPGPNKIAYSDFTFDTTTNMYVADLSPARVQGDIKLKFNNKKIVESYQNVPMLGRDVRNEFKYTYNTITPTLPPKPQL